MSGEIFALLTAAGAIYSSRVLPKRYLPPPAGCEKLESIVARFGGSMQVNADARLIVYALPPAGWRDALGGWQEKNSQVCGPEFVARLPGGCVFGSGVVLAPDGAAIARDVSLDFGKRFEQHWMLTFKRIEPPVAVSGTTGVIATTLASGYSHWLLEELPRLLRLDLRECEAIVANAVQPYAREALALRGFAGRVIQAGRFSHVRCERLVVPSLPSVDGFPMPETGHVLGEFSAPLVKREGGVGERLYISRAKARRRRVENEAELWPQLEARGFVKLHLETMTWAEQINAFHHAKIVVGPHGAGLANLVFSQAGTRVVELFGGGFFRPVYWFLSAVQGLDYRPVAPGGSVEAGVDSQADRLDFKVDVAKVLAALA